MVWKTVPRNRAARTPPAPEKTAQVLAARTERRTGPADIAARTGVGVRPVTRIQPLNRLPSCSSASRWLAGPNRAVPGWSYA